MLAIATLAIILVGHASWSNRRITSTLRDLRSTAPFFAERGRDLIVARNYSAALANTERALALAPDEARYHQLRADILQTLGKYSEARSSYRRVLNLDTNLAGASPRFESAARFET